MSDQEIRFRIVVEDNAAPAAQRTDAAFQRVGASATGAGRQATAAMRMLPAQLSDVATQLAGGQNPFLVLMQQGLQTRDMFGSFRAAGQGIVSMLTPLRVALGGSAAALGLVAYAAYQGYEQANLLTKGIELTGGAAGRTAGQVDVMARALSSATGSSIGTAREAMDGLATSGAFVGTNMDVAGRAVVALQRLTGQAAGDIVKHLAGMRDGVTAWSVAANRSWNYLTAAQVQAIRNFEAQGRTQDAMRVSLEALAGAMESRVVPAMGLLEKAVQGVKNAGSGFWDWLTDIGKTDTVEQQLEKVRKRIAFMRTTPDVRGVKDLRQQEYNLQEQLRLEQRGAEARARAAETNQREIMETSRSYIDAQLGITSAFEAKQLAEQLRSSQARRLAADLEWQHRSITAEKYTAIIIATERERVAAEINAARQAIDIEKGRVTEKPEDELNKKRAILAAEAAYVSKLAEKDKLEAKIRADQLRVGTQQIGGESAASLLLQAERAAATAAEQGITERRRAAMESANELVRTNVDLTAELIKDDRARAIAQLDIEADKLRKQLALDDAFARERAIRAQLIERTYRTPEVTIDGKRMGGEIYQEKLSDGERQALISQAEEATKLRESLQGQFNSWRLLRERQITEQLKPEWQRQVELWADTQRDMKQRYDTFMGGWLDTGRQTFQEWARTGKISGSGLVDFLRGQFASLLYDRFLSGAVASIGNSLFGSLFGSFSGAGAVAGIISGGSGLKLPGRAVGGSVGAGQAFLVGERGPEVLQMGAQSGYITPNHALGGQQLSMAVGQGQTINVGQGVSMAQVYDAVRRGNADNLAQMHAYLKRVGVVR